MHAHAAAGMGVGRSGWHGSTAGHPPGCHDEPVSRREPDSRAGSGYATAGVSVLARLLWAGVVAGFGIGGLVAVALFARAGLDEALMIFSFGGVVGVVAGVAAQVLNAVVLTSSGGPRAG